MTADDGGRTAHSNEDFTVGVEEEFFVVDAETGQLRTDAKEIVGAARRQGGGQIEEELSRAQVETGSDVCRTMDELRASVSGLRDQLHVAARQRGARVMASGTHPTSHWSDAGGVTPAAAYLQLAEEYGLLTDEQVVSGCHVHVGVADPEVAIGVMNRVRVHLPTLIALSANSPFWDGIDTRYASYRTEIFHRWPTTGVPEPFASRAEFDELLATMRSIGAIDAPARLYWDLRPSDRYTTLEFRAADVMMRAEEAVAVAVIARALVETYHGHVVEDRPLSTPRPELLRAALWRAARYGLEDRLFDVEATESHPAAEVVGRLLEVIRPVLSERGEWDEVRSLVERLLVDGTGAVRQRRALERRGEMGDVLDLLMADTVA